VHARLVVKSEAPDRVAQAERLRGAARQLSRATKNAPLRSYAQWDYQDLPQLLTNNEKFWQLCADRLALKTGGFDIGIGFEAAALAKLTETEILRAFEQLAPIYQALSK
jgi:hypothetical protein